MVASLYNVNDAAHSIRASDIQRGHEAAKFRLSGKILKNIRNTAKFARNVIKYMLIHHI